MNRLPVCEWPPFVRTVRQEREQALEGHKRCVVLVRSPDSMCVTDNEHILLTLEAKDDGPRRCLCAAGDIPNRDLGLMSPSASNLINNTASHAYETAAELSSSGGAIGDVRRLDS